MPIDSKECFTSLTTDGQLYEIYLAAEAGGSGNFVLKTGDTMTGKLNLPASTLTSVPLNLGVGVTPTSSVAGDIFYDGTLKFKESTLIRTVAATEKANQFVNYQSVNATNNSNPALAVLQGGGGGGLKIINLGSGESLRIEDESPESTPFVVSASGRVGIGVTPDATVALKVDSTGIKFGDGTTQTTAAVAGVTSISAGTTGLTPATATTGAVTLAGTLAIANGGTGSTTAANALIALGAVAKAGDTMTGKLILPASTLASAPITIPHGVDPTSYANGDIWLNGSIRYRDQTGTTRFVADLNRTNTFTQRQTISADSFTADPALKITQLGSGEALRVEDDTTPDSTAFVVSASGRVGIGVAPDATVALKVDSTGIKFSDNSIQTTAAVAGVTSVSATSPITSTGGTTPVISTSMATNRLLGRSTAATGVAEEIAIGTGLSLTAGTLSNTGVLSDTTAAQGGTQLLNMVQITSAAYSAIVTPTANTLYIIVG